MASYGIEADVSGLLSGVGLGKRDFQLEPLTVSGNNRVFALHCAGTKLVLKWYFHDATDTRDRLGYEFGFLEHAWAAGLRCIPQPLAKDQRKFLALYEYVEGEKIDASQVNEALIQQAAKFLAQLNTQHSRATASELPAASEACFSISAHFAMVDARLARLEQMPVGSDIDKTATEFVRRLKQFWHDTKARLLTGCESMMIDPVVALPESERCLSPSDFGFHNALLRPDGDVCFIDFEYAGWDDPAKAIGDFFSHPGVAVPHSQIDSFMAIAFMHFREPERMALRVRLLEPISQIKWCCIILNEFLPTAAKRRNFADPSTDANSRKVRQLEKANSLFQTILN